jgi:hypothetical protein
VEKPIRYPYRSPADGQHPIFKPNSRFSKPNTAIRITDTPQNHHKHAL